VDNYGTCRKIEDLSDRYKKLIAHFMGALAHIATDHNIDEFFGQTVAERKDCPPTVCRNNDPTCDPFATCNINYPVPSVNSQQYTDQEMDGYLARTEGIELYQYFPSSRTARTDVQDSFLEDMLGDTLLFCAAASQDLGDWLDRQWDSVDESTNSQGKKFDEFQCRHQPDYGKVCDNLVLECPDSCTLPPGCPGAANTCNDVVTKRCIPFGEDECNGALDFCEIVPVYRTPYHFLCDWAINGRHWQTEGGGVDDSARLIAENIRQAWRIMRDARAPYFVLTGIWPDKRMCVGEREGDNCLEEQTIRVLGAKDFGSPQALPGTLSVWSAAQYIEQIKGEFGSNYLGFRLKRIETSLSGVDCHCTGVSQARSGCLDLDLTALSDEERSNIGVISNTLFKAFIEQKKIHVRVELDDRSPGGRCLLKDVRLAGTLSDAPSTADAGEDRFVECGSSGGTDVTMDGTESSDPNDDPLTYLWTAPGILFDDPSSPTPSASFPYGTTQVTLEVSDGQPTHANVDLVEVTVQDTDSPSLTLPDDITVNCNGPLGTPVELGEAVATDVCCDDV